MTDVLAAKPEGLRARKRRATERAIEMAALEIALDRGVDAVTVDEVCDVAFISRSTFFNYYTTRDWAIVGRPAALPPLEDCLAVIDEDPSNLGLGVYRIVVRAMRDTGTDPEIVSLRNRLLEEQPEAGLLTLSMFLESWGQLAFIAKEWLQRNPSHQKLNFVEREATLAVSLVHTTVGSIVVEFSAGKGNMELTEDAFFRTCEGLKQTL